jgi:hypothetical protein
VSRHLTFGLSLFLAACGGSAPPVEGPAPDPEPSMPGPDQARLLLERLEGANAADEAARPGLLTEIEDLPLDAPEVLEARRICVRMHRDTITLQAQHRAFEPRIAGIEGMPADQQEALRAEGQALLARSAQVEAIMERCVRALTNVIVAFHLEEEFAGEDPEPVAGALDGELTDDDPRIPDDDSPYDAYPVELAAGWQIDVQMTSTDFDAYLWLVGPDGSALVQDDDGGEGTNARFTHAVTATGTHVIRANSSGGAGRGTYHLEVHAGPPTP